MKILIDIKSDDRITLIKFFLQQRIEQQNNILVYMALGLLLDELGYTWRDDDIKIPEHKEIIQ